MNLEHFSLFIKTHFSQIGDVSHADIQEIGEKFKTYLEDIFKDKMEKLDDIWNIDPLYVILNQGHPLKMKGYHPALVLHFTEFVRIEAEKYEEENPEEAKKLREEFQKEKDGKKKEI